MTISKISYNDKVLTDQERQDILRWFNEDVLEECPTADINDVVIFYEPKEIYTSIQCELELENGTTHSFRLAGRVR